MSDTPTDNAGCFMKHKNELTSPIEQHVEDLFQADKDKFL